MMPIMLLNLVCFCGFRLVLAEPYSVTIYPEYLSQNGRSHFEADRWQGHHGIDDVTYIPSNKAIGTKSGRWLKQDDTEDTYVKVPEDPNRKGYPDPNYFKQPKFQKMVAAGYLENLRGYGYGLNTIMALYGQVWPHWMNTSLHNGTFPNNLDAGAEMALLLLESIYNYTGGYIPPYFEAVNEPNTMWQTVNWTTLIDYYRLAARKLKKRFPEQQRGGPAYTGGLKDSDVDNFLVWNRIQDFLDMALEDMDFFSFHAFNSINVTNNSHTWGGFNEARLVGVIDLIESHSQRKQSRIFPIVVSEYGLAENGLAQQTSLPFAQWAYVFLHISERFTFYNYRGFIDRAGAFILDHGFVFPSGNMYYANHSYTSVIYAYQFWQPFQYDYRFLRVDAQYNGRERRVSPLALADSKTNTIYVFLQNYNQTQVSVNLNFNQSWTLPVTVNQTCVFLNSQSLPVFQQKKEISFRNGNVTIPSEGACYYAIRFKGLNVQTFPTIEEKTYYASSIVIPINNRSLEITVQAADITDLRFATVRLGVSLPNMQAVPKPTSVYLNGQMVTASFDLYNSGLKTRKTQWGVYVYEVPQGALKENDNVIHLVFAQTGGFVSTAAIVVGTRTG